MITYHSILGNEAQASFADKLHDLDHAHKVDYLKLASDDIQRKRLIAVSSQGKECGIALPRGEKLYDGAILELNDEYALVVRCSDIQFLRCKPINTAAALELGYFAGNMHWSVRYDGDILEIALKGKLEDYQERLQHLCINGRISLELESV